MDTAQNKLSSLQIGIIGLAAATAIIHIVLAIQLNLNMFYMNGAGYIVLTIAYFLPQLKKYQNIIRWVFIAFTALTLVGYFVVNRGNSFTNPIGLIDKAIEAALIVLLYLDGRKK